MPKGVYVRTEKAKRNISKGHLGQIAWNKGKKMPQISGEKHYLWKGGYKDSSGYFVILKPDHPFCSKDKYVKRGRLVMEKIIGRYLDPKEVVHHINGITDDDRPENLRLFENNSKHMNFHKNERRQ